jgi:hypothetical protein
MDWRFGSSGRVPALQARSPKLKPQSHKTKTKTLLFYCQVKKFMKNVFFKATYFGVA